MKDLRRYYIPWTVIFLCFAALTVAGVMSIHAKVKTPRTAITAPQVRA